MADTYRYRCNDCGREYAAGGIHYLCPECSHSNTADRPPRGVLRVLYDYNSIRQRNTTGDLFEKLQSEGFLSLLPLKSLDSLPPLRVGNTPLYKSIDAAASGLTHEVYLKDDSQNPTFSFKDRASALVSAWAKENGIGTIVAASTGNAGSSLAGICASQKQKAMIFVPAAATMAKLTQIMMYGARIIPVNGTYDQAFDLSVEASRQFGFYNRNTAFNPFTIEGKKTVSFEIYSQLSQQLPDRIFIPVGDGVILSGVFKGFEDLLELGIIDRMPVIVAVQAKGSNNLVSNLGSAEFRIKPSTTIADSISVDIPRNFYMANAYLQQYQGEWTEVDDDEIIRASRLLSAKTGLFTEPAAAAAYAGWLKYLQNNLPEPDSRNIVLLTGSGLKDLKPLQSVLHLPEPVDPDPSVIGHLFHPVA